MSSLRAQPPLGTANFQTIRLNCTLLTQLQPPLPEQKGLLTCLFIQRPFLCEFVSPKDEKSTEEPQVEDLAEDLRVEVLDK